MFQRFDPYNPTVDANLTRNSVLLKSYLSGAVQQGRSPGLTDLPVPGFSDRSFAAKYDGKVDGGSRDQILTEIFDYIRSGINLQDTYFDKDIIPPSEGYEAQTLSAKTKATLDPYRYAPRGIVIPAAVTFPGSSVASSASGKKEVAGFGRFPTIAEVSIVFYHAGYKADNAHGNQYYWHPQLKNQLGVSAHLMRMFLIVETYNPMQGYSRATDTSADDRNPRGNRMIHKLLVKSNPASADQWGTPINFGFPNGTVTNAIDASSSYYSGSNAGGIEGVLHTMGASNKSDNGARHGKFKDPAGDDRNRPPWMPLSPTTETPFTMKDANWDFAEEYPFQGHDCVELPIKNGLEQTFFDFGGLKADLQVWFDVWPLQFVELDFPAARFPVPTDAYWEDPGGFAWDHPKPSPTTPPDVISTPGYSNNPLTGESTFNSDASPMTLQHDSKEYPWACALLRNRQSPTTPFNPEAMKSLAYRIWWICEAWPGINNGRAGEDNPYPKFDSTTKKLYSNSAPYGYNFYRRWRNIIQSGDVVRSVVPKPASNGVTDIRTMALKRFKNGDSQPFETLPDYGNQLIRHVSKVFRQPTPGSTVPPDSVAESGGIALQTQILRSGGGTPFVFSGITDPGPVSQNRPNLYYTPPRGGGTAVVRPDANCSLEPYRQLIAGKPNYVWERRSYGITGTQILFGNLADVRGAAGFKTGDYGVKAAYIPYKTKSSGQPVHFVPLPTSQSDTGDFDTGVGSYPDGSLCNKPDEGHVIWRVTKSETTLGHKPDPRTSADWTYKYPYFDGDTRDEPTDTFFSPNRQIPSPGMFGSLLVGDRTNWQTLCFSPNPASIKAGSSRNSDGTVKTNHPGFDSTEYPKDHLLLDLFTMPIVEPWAISEPFSTAGKVNLNCQIVPFSYIQRTTALRAALQSVRITAVNPNQVKSYKTSGTTSANYDENFRLQLDRDETVKGIMSLFDDPNVPYAPDRFYRSASQICERFLYPKYINDKAGSAGPKWSRNDLAIRTFWSNHNLGGDNTREKPYSDLYPRLTTKSNTYTVHMRVQKLRPQRGRSDQDFLRWEETEDCVAAEYRGETQIERYLDPQDRRFDPTDNSIDANDKFNVDATEYDKSRENTRSVEFAYRFRVIGSKRFAPIR